jgi:hypothetical protein
MGEESFHHGASGSDLDDFMWDSWWRKWHRSRFFSEFLGSSLLFIIPACLHTYLSPPHEVCNGLVQAAYYYILGL